MLSFIGPRQTNLLGKLLGFPDRFPLSSLTRDASMDLDSPITEEEIQRAIGRMETCTRIALNYIVPAY